MIERARWILIGAAMMLVAVAFSWSCGSGGGTPLPCPTIAGGIPVTTCFTPAPPGPFLQAISLCPGPPPTPTPISTSSAIASPTPIETTCPGPIITAVPSAAATVQFHAVGTFSDGSTQDITNGSSTTWTTDDPSVVTPNTSPAGSYFAVGPGCATINASSGGISGSPAAIVDVAPFPSSCPTP